MVEHRPRTTTFGTAHRPCQNATNKLQPKDRYKARKMLNASDDSYPTAYVKICKLQTSPTRNGRLLPAATTKTPEQWTWDEARNTRRNFSVWALRKEQHGSRYVTIQQQKRNKGTGANGSATISTQQGYSVQRQKWSTVCVLPPRCEVTLTSATP